MLQAVFNQDPQSFIAAISFAHEELDLDKIHGRNFDVLNRWFYRFYKILSFLKFLQERGQPVQNVLNLKSLKSEGLKEVFNYTHDEYGFPRSEARSFQENLNEFIVVADRVLSLLTEKRESVLEKFVQEDEDAFNKLSDMAALARTFDPTIEAAAEELNIQKLMIDNGLSMLEALQKTRQRFPELAVDLENLYGAYAHVWGYDKSKDVMWRLRDLGKGEYGKLKNFLEELIGPIEAEDLGLPEYRIEKVDRGTHSQHGPYVRLIIPAGPGNYQIYFYENERKVLISQRVQTVVQDTSYVLTFEVSLGEKGILESMLVKTSWITNSDTEQEQFTPRDAVSLTDLSNLTKGQTIEYVRGPYYDDLGKLSQVFQRLIMIIESDARLKGAEASRIKKLSETLAQNFNSLIPEQLKRQG